MNKLKRVFDPLGISLQGVHSIAASAGTGKTFSITTLYLRYILEADCRVDDILVTTFTEAATAELKERIRFRLNAALELIREFDTQAEAEEPAAAEQVDEVLVRLLTQAGAWNDDKASLVRERLETAILDFDHAPIFTIHGFCNRVLQEQVFETSSRFRAELVTSVDELVHEAICDFVSSHWTPTDSPLAMWLDLDEGLWKSMRELVLAAIDSPLANVVPVDDNLETLLESTLLDDFSDVAIALVEIWTEDRDQICDLLFAARENGFLNGNTHGREGQLERSVAFIDAFVEDPTPGRFGKNEPDQLRLSQSRMEKGTKKAHKANVPRHRAFDEIETILERVTEFEDHRSQILISLLSKLAHVVREQITKRKRDLGVMTFSDLLHQVYQALTGSQSELLLDVLRRRYRVALVDEFQDTDPVQYRIFQRIFQEAAQQSENELRAFVMIGDVKQSIFRFRGADVHSYLHATEATPAENRHPMDVNWRSDTSLVDAIQSLFASQINPFLSDQIPLPDVKAKYGDRISPGPPLQLTFVSRHEQTNPNKAPSAKLALEQVLRQTIDDIVDQLQNPPTTLDNAGNERLVAAGDLAVLCRTGRQLRQFQAELANRGVPSVLQTEESIFDTFEAEAMAFLLRALVALPKQQALLNALATPIFALSASELEGIQQDDMALSSRYEDFRGWHDLWHQQGFIVMWRRLIDQQDTIAKLAGSMLGERQVTNYLQLGESLHRYVVNEHAGPTKLLRWLEAGIANPESHLGDENQLRLETDADAVQLCTIHKSKGLEYPIVYCPTLWHVPRFPAKTHVIARVDADGRPLENSEIDVGSKHFDKRQETDKFEGECEDRRLLYVALTRARHQCRIYWTACGSADKSALGEIMLPNLKSKDDDETIQCSLRSWVESLDSDGIEFSCADPDSQFQKNGVYSGPPKPDITLVCRDITRTLIPPLVQISFSSLSRSAGPFSHIDIQDRDETEIAPDPAPSESTTDKATERIPLASVRGGRQLGNLVHDVFENLLCTGRFRGADRGEVQAAVEQEMTKGLPLNNLDSALQGTLTDSMTDWLTGAVQANGLDFRLIDLPSDDLACEMPFLLSVADSKQDADLKEIENALQLSKCAAVRNYAHRMGNLKRSRLRGFLVGFIDLVFCAEGRWYVLDYKTNHLGATFGDYATAKLEASMAQHDYILQYHLYALALDLFLQQRIPDYDYERDFGGAIYFFVRGYQADSAQSTGIYFDRPTREVIDSLESSLKGVATCQS